MLKFAVNILLYGIILNLRASADSMEDLKQKYVEMIMGCAKDYPVTADDIQQLKNQQMPDSAKCLFACAYKTSGMMDEEGNLSVEGVNEIAKKYLSDNPERLQKAKDFTDLCKEVNDIKVSDGNRGCERAALIFKCTIEKAPQFDFGV